MHFHFLSPGLDHTPGLFYGISYWFATVLFTYFLPKKKTGKDLWLHEILFFVVITAFMSATDNPPKFIFFLYVFIELSLSYFNLYATVDLNREKRFYYLCRIFLLGEFVASFSWQLYYFGIERVGGLYSPVACVCFVITCYIVLYGVFALVEGRISGNHPQIRISKSEVLGAIIITAMTFALSNISYAVQNTPFSSIYTAEIFMLRTMADLGGVGILTIYHILLIESTARNEAEMQQQLLRMQYNNYQASQQSVELINQKYHDLKHQISALRYELGDNERFFYLNQMEDEIKEYEALNKTGHKVLDTILTTKSLLCQKRGITMNIVADGASLEIMDSMDIYSLFGNAIDNAIEAVDGVENAQEKLIKVDISKKKLFVHIRIDNRYQDELKYDGDDLMTTKGSKDYHGYGVKSMRSIVEKYDGSMSIKTENGWFRLSILIPVMK